MAKYLTTDAELTAVADAIREAGGTSGALEYPDGFVSAIENISGGGSSDRDYCIEFRGESFSVGWYQNTKSWDGTIEYSYDGKIWTVWNGTSAIPSEKGVVFLRGSNNTKLTVRDNEAKGFWLTTASDRTIHCVGNIENLLDYETVKNNRHPAMADFCFECLFSGCTNLLTGPSLPATDLSDYCYLRMFLGCSKLTQAPALPATTLTTSCYREMFYNCSALLQAPSLPATTLETQCYNAMFYGCRALTTIPKLRALNYPSYCCRQMFYGCSNIKMSRTQTTTYTNAYRIPDTGTGTGTASSALYNIFSSTGGTFTGTADLNTTYYTSNTIV